MREENVMLEPKGNIIRNPREHPHPSWKQCRNELCFTVYHSVPTRIMYTLFPSYLYSGCDHSKSALFQLKIKHCMQRIVVLLEL